MDSVLLNAANVTIFCAILVGASLHRRRALHVRVMFGCFAADLLLLLAVELSQHAIGTAMSTAGGTGRQGGDLVMLAVHIAFAISTLVFWGLQIANGVKLLRGRRELLPRHKRLAILFVFVRLGNVVTAFFVG